MQVIRAEIRAFLRNEQGQRSAPFVVRLGWSTDDPLAVRMVAANAHWQYARSLLHQGCHTGRCGAGDVVVWPEDGVVIVSLRHGSRADIVIPRPAVLAFLNATERVMPLGCEDLGDELDRWLEDLPDCDP